MGSNPPKGVDMGALGALGLLKNEASSISRAGIQWALEDKAKNLSSFFHPYLSGSAVKEYGDQQGVEFETYNAAIYATVPRSLYTERGRCR
jgi:hypothetical protein